MTDSNIHDELRRVCAGFMGLPPITFPIHPRTAFLLAEKAKPFFENPALSPLQRALLLRKAAVYLTRNGISRDTEFNLILGINWFLRNPTEIALRIGFRHAARLEGNGLAACWRSAHRNIGNDVHDDCQEDLQSPLTPKILVLSHQGYVLERLTHARHQVDAGTAAENCLVLKDEGRPAPNPAYWNRVKDGSMALFTLSKDSRIIVIFAVMHGRVIDMQTLDWSPDLPAVMALCADAVQTLLGPVAPIRADMLWPSPPPPPVPRPTPHPGQMPLFPENAA